MDVGGSNGVVHVIDRVLYPLTTAGNLVQTLSSDPEGRSVHKHGLAKRWALGCVIFSHKLRQKWYVTGGTKFTKPRTTF